MCVELELDHIFVLFVHSKSLLFEIKLFESQGKWIFFLASLLNTAFKASILFFFFFVARFLRHLYLHSKGGFVIYVSLFLSYYFPFIFAFLSFIVFCNLAISAVIVMTTPLGLLMNLSHRLFCSLCVFNIESDPLALLFIFCCTLLFVRLT